jgi:iron complex transport system ATP-binding protein
LIDHSGYQGKVLLLDEPSSALDIKQTKRLYDQLRSFNADGGTVLVIEHNINYAANFSDRMMIITAGRLSALGHTHEVFNKQVLDTCFDTNGQVISTPNAAQSNYHYVLTPQQRGNNQQEINHE